MCASRVEGQSAAAIESFKLVQTASSKEASAFVGLHKTVHSCFSLSLFSLIRAHGRDSAFVVRHTTYTVLRSEFAALLLPGKYSQTQRSTRISRAIVAQRGRLSDKGTLTQCAHSEETIQGNR